MNRKERRALGKKGGAVALPGAPGQVAAPAVAFAEGLKRHQAGDLGGAAAIYRAILAVEPAHADSLHLLGVIANQQGDHARAVDLISKAIAKDPKPAAFYSNLSNPLFTLGRAPEAVEALERAVALDPAFVDAWANLCYALKTVGRTEEAVAAGRKAVALRPSHAAAQANLAGALAVAELHDEAEAAARAAIALAPGLPEAQGNLAIALHGQGRLWEAQQAIERALELRPGSAELLNNKGAILRDQDRLEEARAAFEQAATLAPDYADVWSNLGNVYDALGRLEDAEVACRKAIAIDPKHAGARNNLGNALKSRGALARSTEAYRDALVADPTMIAAASNVLFGLNYDPSIGDDALFEEHRRFGARFAAYEKAAHANARDPERRLRVGFVSADFGVHPVGWFLLGPFGAFDPARTEVACYSARRVQDWVTAKLRAAAAIWRPIIGLSDETLARQIRADGIDVLVDLSGHTAGNRLGAFAHKPAPIQISWLGYFHTTGLSQIDAVLMDEASVPRGSEGNFVERVLRLPTGRFCYWAPDYVPPVAPPPALRNGHVTFGSFNNLTKATPDVIATWCRVLAATPGSRLVLKWKTFADPAERARIAALFAAQGIGAERLELRGASGHAAMLGEYGDIDIGLDPFPFSGGLTSCEALWMGLPVVTLPGTRPVSRQTLGFLRALGREDWVAKDGDDYVALAVALARNPETLAADRAGQRARMAASPLCDAKAHAAAFETAIRDLWRNWCATPAT